MSDEKKILDNLKLIAQKKNIPESKIQEIGKALESIKGKATKSKVKTRIISSGFGAKGAIDTGDVDFWLGRIIDILNKK